MVDGVEFLECEWLRIDGVVLQEEKKSGKEEIKKSAVKKVKAHKIHLENK